MTAGCHLLIHRRREKVVLSTVYGGEGKSTMEVLAGEKNMTEKQSWISSSSGGKEKQAQQSCF